MDTQICPSCGEANPARFRLCGFCGTALAPVAPPQQVRKIVTLIFVDLKGSTDLGERLDPEAMHEVKERYFTAMAAEIVRHGGKIEKYIGDAIMAVFGLPRAHEDDALRAVRAAFGMQRALVQLNAELRPAYGVTLANRTGVNTGEVVASADSGADQKLATGDAVNVTARLEQAAPENEILIGELTYGLVRDAVRVEAIEPLTLKGKAEPVPAYRLMGVADNVAEGRARRDDAPMVGRQAELGQLAATFSAVAIDRVIRMTTVVGDAGVGKSRLIREFVASTDTRADVVRGRCLPYGDGITFWPFLEIVRAAVGIREDDSPETATARLAERVGDADTVERVASIAGLTSTQFSLPELFWGARRFLELLAAERPLIMVVDDIHWAEPTFLDLLEHILDGASDASILLLCTARHDFVARHPDWADRAAADRIVLEPLTDADSDQIVRNLLGGAELADGVRKQIASAAEGNPLFVEQMLAMLIEGGALRHDGDRWVNNDPSATIRVPATIQALLDARLDQLTRDERAIIEPASVIGLQFPESAVTEMVSESDRPQVPERLADLAAKRLVRADSIDDDGTTFRFHHILIRDAAYQRLLKRTRASLHERFVGWADRINRARNRDLEFQEILGFHLERAYLDLADLGPLDDHGLAIGADAAHRLSSAGRRAFARGDMHAAANLLRRASGLLPPDDERRLWILPDLGEALAELGEFEAARVAIDESVRAGRESSDAVLTAHAALTRLLVDFYAGGGEGWSRRVTETAEHANAAFSRSGHEIGHALAWRLLYYVASAAGRYERAAEAAEHIIRHGRRARETRLAMRGSVGLAMAALGGPMPVRSAIDRCEQLLRDSHGDRRTAGLILGVLAELYAMEGAFERGRDAYQRARETLELLGPSVLASATSVNSWRVEMLAGDPAAAEAELRRDIAGLRQMGEHSVQSTLAAYLAHVKFALGDDSEADTFSRMSEELAAEDDVEAQALWRGVRARVFARQAMVAEADALISEALALVEGTDALTLRADILLDGAGVLELSDRLTDARAVLEEARSVATRKGNRVVAARITEAVDRSGSGAGRPFVRP